MMPQRLGSILIVEDSPIYADLVRVLTRAVFGDTAEIVTVGTLAGLADALKSYRPFLVLLDLTLPDSDGLTTLELTIVAVGDATPIVIITGATGEELAVSCVERGADDFMSKVDMTFITLRRCILLALARRAQRRLDVMGLDRGIEARDHLDQFRALLHWAAPKEPT